MSKASRLSVKTDIYKGMGKRRSGFVHSFVPSEDLQKYFLSGCVVRSRSVRPVVKHSSFGLLGGSYRSELATLVPVTNRAAPLFRVLHGIAPFKLQPGTCRIVPGLFGSVA